MTALTGTPAWQALAAAHHPNPTSSTGCYAAGRCSVVGASLLGETQVMP